MQPANPGVPPHKWSKQRRFPRYRTDLPLRVRDHQERDLGGHCFVIAEGGLGGMLPQPIPVGSVVQLRFAVPTHPAVLEVWAVVRYCLDLRHGFEFVSLTEGESANSAASWRLGRYALALQKRDFRCALPVWDIRPFSVQRHAVCFSPYRKTAMPPTPPVRAAQYLRMSTEHQQYSLDNQAEAIRRYAEGHGFVVVKTYSDAGKSGLMLKHRAGLNQLLQDVVSQSQDYRAILVYDVSRWGRFQDADEAAHYEFLCKHAGIHVHYCAEPFANDDTISSSILKALKRTMAAEYSRELGVKVYAGKKRLVQLGFRVGGQAGYGLRRMLLSADGQRKQQLKDGERKSLATDRVILVPGPKKEVECVRLMFQMGLRKSYLAIAQELNSRGIPHLHGRPWTVDRAQEVLTNPKYTGCNVWGRTSAKLRSRQRPTDRQQWVVSPTTFRPVVDQRTFDRVQAAHPKKSAPTPDEVLLEKLRGLLASVGKLSKAIVLQSPGVPDPATYVRRFGSLRRAFELAGYRLRSAQLGISEQSRRRHHLQKILIAQIDGLCPSQARVCFVRNRPVLILDGGAARMPISICPRYKTPVQKMPRWALRVPRTDRQLTTLLCLPNQACGGFEAFYVVQGVDMGTRYNITGEGDPLLQRGRRLNSLTDLCTVGRSFV